MNNENKKLQAELEELKLKLQEEITPNFEVESKKLATKQREYDQLKVEVEKLKTGYDGDDEAYKEYQKQLKDFDQFRFFKLVNGTNAPNKRFAQVRIWGNNYLADRSLSRTFLHTFLTTLMNFDTPALADITLGFTSRGGTEVNGSTLVANTGGANPTKFSAEWVLQEWNKYRDYFDKMVVVGADSEIIKKGSDGKELSEIVNQVLSKTLMD